MRGRRAGLTDGHDFLTTIPASCSRLPMLPLLLLL